MKVRKCAVCGKRINGFRINHYCVACMPYVQRIQFEVGRKMASAGLPSAAGNKCVDCGKPATARDHRYYSAPLEVEYVCTYCNMKRGPALDIARVVKNWCRLYGHQSAIPERPDGLPQWDGSPLNEFLAAEERDYIESAIEKARHNKTAAARALGITYRSLRYRMGKLGMDAEN